ncbi:MAG: hypothetical protein BRC31_01980, partial [Actinobacteria bacterium QS_5_72_10]
MASTASSAADALNRARAAGRRAVLVTLADPHSHGVEPGAAIVMGDDARPLGGTLGTDELDAAAGELARAVLD